MISSFSGPYRFLSNFYPVAVQYGGLTFNSVEHAFQAAKTEFPSERKAIQAARTPGEAKRLGRKATLKPRWESVKVETMRLLIDRKFDPGTHPELAARLLATGDDELVEGNTWGDTFWGQCPLGTGHNTLGKLLMEKRAALRRP